MEFTLPTSLIREVQISLRKQAGIPSYNPEDPSLPELPSLDEVIAGFDPSPPYLRCKQCHGRLLRGLQSTICVFCGAHQKREIPPDPISFKSTFGYKMLLESLDVDGSEAVGLATGASDSTKSQSAPKDELVLSDLLDLEIKWPAESEKIESSIINKAAIQSKSSLNMAGVDLDNFFSEENKETVPSVPEEPLVPSKQISSIESHAFPAQGSSSLFENAQSSDIAVGSVPGVGDSFAVWEPEFQSASSGALPGDSKSFDPFPSSSATVLSIPVDIAFGLETDITFVNKMDNDGTPKNDSVSLASKSDNWIQDDLWHTSNTTVSNPSVQFETDIKTNDDGPKDISRNPASTSDNWIQDDLWQTSTTKASDKEKINEDDDSFDAWQDFTSSENAPDPLSNSWKQTVTGTSPSDEQVSNTSHLTNGFHEMDFGSFSQPNLFSEASSLQIGSTDVNRHLEPSIADRVASADIEARGDTKRTANGDENFNSTAQSETANSDVEMLISQMPDLSFMLESKLSIPPKLDSLDTLF